jgi:hypothetical protein
LMAEYKVPNPNKLIMKSEIIDIYLEIRKKSDVLIELQKNVKNNSFKKQKLN